MAIETTLSWILPTAASRKRRGATIHCPRRCWPGYASQFGRLRGLGYAVRKIKEDGLPDSEQDGEERVHFRAFELWKVVGPEERDEEV